MCENIGSLKKCRGEHNRGKPDFERGNSLEEKKRSLRVRKGGLWGVIKSKSLIGTNWKSLQDHPPS